MSWVAVGVRTTRELLRGLSPEAKVLWHVAREYCSEEETDGVIADTMLSQLGIRAEIEPSELKRVVSSLVRREVWERIPDACIDVTFQDVNPSHDDRQRERDSAKERKRRERQRRAEEAADSSVSHTVTSQRDNRGGNGRFRVVSRRDTSVDAKTEVTSSLSRRDVARDEIETDRGRVLSHRDVTAATETETEQDSYTRRGSSSAKRTGKRATGNGVAVEDDEQLDRDLIDRQFGSQPPEIARAQESVSDDRFQAAMRGEV